MKIYPIETGNFKLDGGAMFGVVPKSIWQKTNPADANNLIEMSMRSLLIEDGNRLTLIDTGLGNKQSDKFFGYYHLFGDKTLDSSLAKLGFCKDDITDVFLTHLHFDHCGGSIEFNKDKTAYQPAFKNAKFWSNKEHWLWATEPNAREKASFLKENIIPIKESGQLEFINLSEDNYIKNSELNFDILCVDGHTEKQMIPHLNYKGKTLVFMADLLPTIGHIPLPYVMSYDTRPLLTLNEKQSFLNLAADKNYFLFLEHDAHNEICTVKHTEKGVRLDKTYTFNEIFN
ncbi:MBL fold metallo-hydrolase [Aureibaculum marinum]|uniref:MBL fold metallo-hydrolase n=1 Tax=Aureibaculum marinum TaxID=2487930 RepID=A0A3N4NSH9_9FLAO|nr:MBL fold metallo-hydrolase [Aureibaculum marinum]RPD96036.1 MBL fold metallo-hydrolase [Aureibaculum marinum]